jgi:ATP:ADP antiporter, AAA family
LPGRMRALNIRSGEHRTVAASFLTLFGLVGSHSILETARDALFLSKIAASNLPYVYIAVAVISLLVTQLQARLSVNQSLRNALMASTAGASLVTLAFWWLLPLMGDLGLYALYAWSGVLTTLVLVYFWSLLADQLTVTQAKRLYGLIGVGSVLGAVIGSGFAGVLTRFIEPVDLVLAAAIGFGLAAVVPRLFVDVKPSAPIAAPGKSSVGSLAQSAAYVGRNAYARRVVMLLIAAAATLTMADFVFKAEIASRVAREDLGSYFASIYFVTNVLSLLTQVFFVGGVMKRLGLGPSLCVLPFLLSLGATGVLVGGGVAAVIAMRGVDGTLRYSVHKTATELLFVPLTEEARRSVKGFIDVVGQRGGQAIASGLILAGVAIGLPTQVFAGLVIAMAATWIVVAFGLRGPYLALIRTHLQEVRRSSEAFPDLDVASLETLIASLDSADDTEALVALNTLYREQKLRLVPGLILYHPSAVVVDRALTLFARDGRTKVIPIVDRLLEHESAPVRSAAIAALSVLEPDDERLQRLLASETDPAVRATIKVNLIASGAIGGDSAAAWLEDQLADGNDDAKIEIAHAISRRQGAGLEHVVVRLSEDVSVDVRRAVIDAMRLRRLPAYTKALAAMLDDSRVRAQVHSALLDHGEDGFEILVSMLRDYDVEPRLRWQVPLALTGFDGQRALDVLQLNLPNEDDGIVRFRTIRSIERLLRRAPTLDIEERSVRATIADTIGRAYHYVECRLALRAGASEDESRKTDGHDTLRRILGDKEEHAIGRLFRLLGFLFRTEDFGELWLNINSDDVAARASSMELIEDLLKGDLRDAVIGLVDDLPDRERLAAAGSFHKPTTMTYDDVLREMLKNSSDAIRALTVFHIGELALQQFRPELEGVTTDATNRADFELALSRLNESDGSGGSPKGEHAG